MRNQSTVSGFCYAQNRLCILVFLLSAGFRLKSTVNSWKPTHTHAHTHTPTHTRTETNHSSFFVVLIPRFNPGGPLLYQMWAMTVQDFWNGRLFLNYFYQKTPLLLDFSDQKSNLLPLCLWNLGCVNEYIHILLERDIFQDNSSTVIDLFLSTAMPPSCC